MHIEKKNIYIWKRLCANWK